jgi:hypothetical protein
MDRQSLDKVAARFGISVSTLKRRIRESGIVPARPGRAWMLTEEEVEVVMDASRYRYRSNSPSLGSATKTNSISSSGWKAGSNTRSQRIQRTRALLRSAWKDLK